MCNVTTFLAGRNFELRTCKNQQSKCVMTSCADDVEDYRPSA